MDVVLVFNGVGHYTAAGLSCLHTHFSRLHAILSCLYTCVIMFLTISVRAADEGRYLEVQAPTYIGAYDHWPDTDSSSEDEEQPAKKKKGSPDLTETKNVS